MTLEPIANEVVFDLDKLTPLLQCGKQGRCVANRSLKFVTHMTKVHSLDGSKSKIRNPLR